MTPAKRALDVIVAALGLLLAAPLLLLIPLLIKLDDGGPVFFRQERVGRHRRNFQMWKFRTMRTAAAGQPLTVGQDPRITRAGHWLREWKLDELPQLIHVLAGDMSLVGPRPEVAAYVRHYSPAQSRILDFLPGITSPASLRFWDEAAILARSADPEQTYISQIMPEKIRIHLEYAARATVWTDLRLVLRTVAHLWPKTKPVLAEQIVRFRRPLIVGTNLLIVALGYWAAFLLRFDFALDDSTLKQFWITLPALMLVRVLPHARFGVFQGYWRHSGLEDLVGLAKSAVVGSAAFVIVLSVMALFPGVPRSVIVLEWVATIFLGGGVRFLVRYIQEIPAARAARSGRRTLIVGTGDEADRLLRELHHRGTPRLRIMGLLAGEANGRGRSLRGIRVIGEIDDLVALVARQRIEFVIIALDAPNGELIQRVVTACVDAGVEFKTLPTFQDLLASSSRLDHLRNVRVQDLLSREPVRLDPERIGATIRDRAVLVTGGAGSIGSELARQIARLGPKELILLDQAESALYFMVLELAEAHPGLRVVPVVCDITDPRNVIRVFERCRPHYVIHAAAYKHVPMMEDNVIEAVRNNVFGTMNLASAAATWGVERFVLISTDKAVRPSSVMGATKRVAERLVLGLPRFARSPVDFRAVRFGNVLGSAGSVIPLFERQVTARKPITVTHPDVERYFMTIPEAAQLVLEAGAIDEASRRITMLEMGQPVRILDLAERLVRLAGMEPYRDVPIVFTGLRPGEKLREQLSSDLEASVPTTVEKIRIVQGVEADGSALTGTIGQLAAAVATGDSAAVLDRLCDLVPECVAPLRNRRSGGDAPPTQLVLESRVKPTLLDPTTAAAS